MVQIFFILLDSAWMSVVQEHHLDRPTPLICEPYKVSTIIPILSQFPYMIYQIG